MKKRKKCGLGQTMDQNLIKKMGLRETMYQTLQEKKKDGGEDEPWIRIW